MKTDDELEDGIGKYLKSEKFKEDFARQVELDTWGNNLPKVYMDEFGNIIEHWKDGTKNIIKAHDEVRKNLRRHNSE